MSTATNTDRDALGRVLRDGGISGVTSDHVGVFDLHRADVVLVSRWLADRDARIAKEARDEIEWWENWSNKLTEYVPEEYEDDIAQEAIIENYLKDVPRLLVEARVATLREAADLACDYRDGEGASAAIEALIEKTTK